MACHGTEVLSPFCRVKIVHDRNNDRCLNGATHQLMHLSQLKRFRLYYFYTRLVLVRGPFRPVDECTGQGRGNAVMYARIAEV